MIEDQLTRLIQQLAALAAVKPSPPCTLGEAAARYIATKRRLAPATHRAYRYILTRLASTLGWTRPLLDVTRADLDAYLARLKPGAAHNAATRIRAFYRWSTDQGLVPAPLLVRSPHKARGALPWSQTDLDTFRARWQPGTRPRLVFECALATGLRRSDLSAALWQASAKRERKDDLVTQKTGTLVWLGALEATRAQYAAPLGRRLSGHSLGLKFTLWVRAAGLRDRSLHGLRKNYLQAAAEAGCTAPELMVLAGWRNLGVADVYLRGVNRQALYQSAQARLQALDP